MIHASMSDDPSSSALGACEGAAAQPWDGFLVGPENALAHAAAVALARGEPTAVSPLIVHGPAGAGKSRVLAGLVAEWLARRPGSSVAHLGADAFATACVEAGARRGGAAWAELRERVRTVDLLVIDDLPRLARTPSAAAELAAALDALDAVGAAFAGSAPLPPAAWDEPAWPPRLLSRLRGGLAVRVEPPGVALRRRFALEMARARGVRLAADALDALAEAADGFRALDGWLARLALAAQVERGGGGALDGARVRALLADDPALAEAVARPTIDAIARAVAARFGVRPADLRGAARHAALVVPRHLAILLAREHAGASISALGRYFGGRDTKTIRHACRAARARRDADPALAAAAEVLAAAWRRATA
jgi:chromosomal replication initiator protein